MKEIIIKNEEEAIQKLRDGEHFTMDCFNPYRNNKKVVLEALEQDSQYIVFCEGNFLNDKDVMSVAISKNGKNLGYASKELKDNADLVLTAIKTFPKAIEYSSERIQNLCKGQDPIKTLTMLSIKELHEEIKQKTKSQYIKPNRASPCI